MNKIILTTLNGQKVVVNEGCTMRAQHIHVEEMLAEGLSLKEAIRDIDGFLREWVPVDSEFGWGPEIDSAESEYGSIEN